MQSNWKSDLSWLSGVEQDFPLGAKATSYLPSATDFDHDYNNDNFELPNWMESRENFGLSKVDLFNDIKFEEHDNSDQVYNGITDMEDDYSQTIKPDDMLVPLSELEPDKYTPQGIGANTLSAVPTSIPKVSIRVNKVQITIPEQGHQSGYLKDLQPSYQISGMEPQHSNAIVLPQPQIPTYVPLQGSEVLEPEDNAHELLNTLVELVANEPNGLTDLITAFNPSMVEQGMDDLLSQLESCNAPPPSSGIGGVTPWAVESASPVSLLSPVPSVGSPSPQSTDGRLLSLLESCDAPSPGIGEVTPWAVEPASPVSRLSPVPSVGSLSPQSTGDRSFHQPQTPIDDSAFQPEDSKGYSFLSILSPDTDNIVCALSPSVVDDDESEGEYSQSEIHSYSRSPRKSKSSSKASSNRKAPYPEGKKERKKEQNKQAALRYRQKKKQEDDEIMSLMEAEEARQKQLKAKYASLKQELKCMKKLMREVFIANGTLSPDAFKKK